MATIQVEDIQWLGEHPITRMDGQDAYPGVDGVVWYLVLEDCRHAQKCQGVCLTHPGKDHLYCAQPFSRSVAATPDGRPVWRWGGDRADLTLTDPAGQKDSFKVVGPNFPVVHLYFRGGRIVYIDGDATPEPSPVACRWPGTD